MQVAKHTVVTLQYRLQKDSQEGDLIEETTPDSPLVFLCGVGQMIPEFENQLIGKKVGSAFDFTIASQDAYGEYDPEAVGVLPLEVFRMDGEIAHDLLVPGKVIPLRDPDGNLLYGTVIEVGEKDVQLNFNHPMAGLNLHFSGQVNEIRDATPEELDHGHVHGPGGHQH